MGRAGQGCIDHCVAVAFLSGRPKGGGTPIVIRGTGDVLLDRVCFSEHQYWYRIACTPTLCTTGLFLWPQMFMTGSV